MKLIALVTMIIDHVGAVFPEAAPGWFHLMGRIAFPIYVFLISEGARHTKSPGKYLGRLFVFGLISEIPFDLAFWGNTANFLEHTNVMFTLFFGASAIFAVRAFEDGFPGKPWLSLIYLPAAAAAAGLAGWLGTDYGWAGVLMIIGVYAAKRRYAQAAVLFTGFLHFYSWPSLFFAALSLVPVFLYNGKRGPRLKWAFYAAYPVHLAILVLIRRLI